MMTLPNVEAVTALNQKNMYNSFGSGYCTRQLIAWYLGLAPPAATGH